MTTPLYSEVILQRRGPLAKVWLAAHFEKKLTKKEIVTTNILKSVEAIVHDGSFPKALRLTGQLLIGIVRIYSRKAKYLLDECNEAKISIQMSFRPGTTSVDLPAEQSTAAFQTITLADTVNEIDLLFQPNMVAFIQTTAAQPDDTSAAVLATPVKPGAALAQARPQDITLAEPFLPSPEQARRGLHDLDRPLDLPWADADLDLDLGLDAPLAVEAVRRAEDASTGLEPFFASPPQAEPHPGALSGIDSLEGLATPPGVTLPDFARSPALSDRPPFFATPEAPAKRVPRATRALRVFDAVTEIPAEQFAQRLREGTPAPHAPAAARALLPPRAPGAFLDDLCSTLKRWYPFASVLPPAKKTRESALRASPAATRESTPVPLTGSVPSERVCATPEPGMWDDDDAFAAPAPAPTHLASPRPGADAELRAVTERGAVSSSTLAHLATVFPSRSQHAFGKLLAPPCTKARAAALFYDLLLMKSRGWVKLTQPEAYAEIRVTLLPSFAEAISANETDV